jgi:hypothetical protein
MTCVLTMSVTDVDAINITRNIIEVTKTILSVVKTISEERQLEMSKKS